MILQLHGMLLLILNTHCNNYSKIAVSHFLEVMLLYNLLGFCSAKCVSGSPWSVLNLVPDTTLDDEFPVHLFHKLWIGAV